MNRRRFVGAAAVVSCAATWPHVARAQTLRKLRVIAFPGGGNGWPIWIAQRQGFFAREGLEVELTPTSGSVYQMTHLIARDFDIAHTAMDNVVAYTEGVGEVALAGSKPLVAIMGGDNGFLHVLARPQYKSYADLRGKRLGVDALGTGFAFVLRKMLLVNGEIDGTISSTPFDIQGEAAGLQVFPAAIGSLQHYQGYVAAVTMLWASGNAGAASAYIRAYRNALAFLYDPAHRSDAIALFADGAKMAQGVAEKVYAIMVDAQGGYEPSAALDLAGVQTVIDLRKRYGTTQTTLGSPAKYVDLSYYRAAG